MKINADHIRIHSAYQTGKASTPAAAQPVSKPIEARESVSISEEAQRAARIAELKGMVQSGQNIVNPDRIAKAMVSEAVAS